MCSAEEQLFFGALSSGHVYAAVPSKQRALHVQPAANNLCNTFEKHLFCFIPQIDFSGPPWASQKSLTSVGIFPHYYDATEAEIQIFIPVMGWCKLEFN